MTDQLTPTPDTNNPQQKAATSFVSKVQATLAGVIMTAVLALGVKIILHSGDVALTEHTFSLLDNVVMLVIGFYFGSSSKDKETK